jgi:hypothetical protein
MKTCIITNGMLVFTFGVGRFAQQKAAVSVRVTDVTGAGISNAHVLVRANQRTTGTQDLIAATGASEGEYTINLQPGIYDVLVSAPCLIPLAAQMKLVPGETKIFPVQMKLQRQVQSEYVSDGCPAPDVFGTPLVDSDPPKLPDRIASPAPAAGNSDSAK